MDHRGRLAHPAVPLRERAEHLGDARGHRLERGQRHDPSFVMASPAFWAAHRKVVEASAAGIQLVLLGALAPACKSKQPVNGQCVFNSDCDETQSLICAGRYCRQQCNLAAPAATRSRDCPSGTLCQPAAQLNNIGACLPIGDNGYCVYHSECSPPFVCNIDGRCSSQCREARDCVAISLDPAAVCRVLAEHGCLVTKEPGRFNVTERLPGVGLVRCYRIPPAIFGLDV